MFNRNIICILLLVILTSSKTTIINMPKSFEPVDEREYSAYLQVMLGHYAESAWTSDNIQQLIASERPSFLTAPEKIVLILATLSDKNTANEEQTGLKIDGSLIRRQIQKYQKSFEVRMMLDVSKEALEKEITEQQSKGNLVNAIIGEEKEIKQIEKILSNQFQLNSKRLLQPTPAPTTDSTYLIKFFFSIIFILVIVGCVNFIAANQGKKDTLLYAKFIADVGAR